MAILSVMMFLIIIMMWLHKLIFVCKTRFVHGQKNRQTEEDILYAIMFLSTSLPYIQRQEESLQGTVQDFLNLLTHSLQLFPSHYVLIFGV